MLVNFDATNKSGNRGFFKGFVYNLAGVHTEIVEDRVTQNIIGAAIEVHRILGPGLLESIYEEALCHEFMLQNIHYGKQVSIDVIYKGCVIHGQRLDLLVENEVIVEIKSLSILPDVATAQVLSYLKSTGLRRALLINFGERRLVDGIKRISL
ncbi:MAG: GxxExxY protein [Thermodesulfobacteriota bacterium]